MMISITIRFITMVRNNETTIRIYIKAVIIIVVVIIIIIVRTVTIFIVEIINIIIQFRLTVRCQGKC